MAKSFFALCDRDLHNKLLIYQGLLQLAVDFKAKQLSGAKLTLSCLYLFLLPDA